MAAETNRIVKSASPTVRRIFWTWLLVQLLVPTVQWLKPRPAPLGWQMYSAALRPFSLQAVLLNGEHRALAVDGYVTVAREEIHWEELLPEKLCNGVPPGTVIKATVGGRESTTACD